MSDETYNGWKNYETWAVGMYLDGNYDGPGTYYAAIETVRNAIEGYEPDQYSTENVPSRVADALKELVEEYTIPHMIDDDHPDPQLHPLVSDLFGAALQSVDWYELADAWIDSVREQAEA
jgi:hypothetical protein